jgi:hypothetical protein
MEEKDLAYILQVQLLHLEYGLLSSLVVHSSTNLGSNRQCSLFGDSSVCGLHTEWLQDNFNANKSVT